MSTMHRIAAAALLCLASACSTYVPSTVAFVSPAALAGRSWDDVLARPAAITVETIFTGTITVDRSLLLDLDSPNAKGVKNADAEVPIFANLVRHETQGTFLVDTGLDASFQHSGHGDIGGFAALFSFIKQGPGEDLKDQLAKRDAHPTRAFFTHMHVDHTSGVPDLPKTVELIAGRGSLQDAYADESGTIMHLEQLDGFAKVEEIDFRTAAPMPPLGPAIDVFGDGSFWAIWTPGHSIGEVSYLVNGKSGAVLLVGDASHTRWGFLHDVAPGKAVDHAAAQRSLEELRAFAAKYPAVKVVFGHAAADAPDQVP